MAKPKPATPPYEESVERAIQALLAEKLEAPDRIKALAVAVRWAAVKARITMAEHGSAFDEIDEEGG